MKHCKIFYLFLFIMLIWFIVGCAYTASFSRSPYVDQMSLQNYLRTKKSKSPEEIIFLKKIPDQPIVILGTLHAPEVEWTAHYTTDDLIKAMQKKAAEIGADAILDFRTKSTPSTHTVGSISPYYGGAVAAVPFKGLHAWGEAIIFVTEKDRKVIEPEQ